MGGGRRKSGKNRPRGGRSGGGGGTGRLFAGRRSVSARHFAGSSLPSSSTSAIDGSFRGGRGKKNGSSRPQRRGTAFGYAYPTSPEEISGGDDAGRSILLAGSGDNPSIVAFVDSRPCEEPGIGVPSYAYDPAVGGGVGLGFRGEEEEEEEIVVYDPAKVGRAGLGFRGGGEEEEEEEVGRVGLAFRGSEEEKEEEEEGEEEEEEERNDEGEEMVGFDSYSTPDVKKERKCKGFQKRHCKWCF